jgi:hypothetical protein
MDVKKRVAVGLLIVILVASTILIEPTKPPARLGRME